MARISSGIKQKDEILMNPPYSSPISSSLSAPNYQKDSSSIRISPVLLLVIAILALVIVFLGILHLLFKIIIKSPTFSQIYNSNRNPDDSSTPNGLQGQLQQLFRLHDSGLDQNAIDALPVFYYRDVVMGLKEPFDCAVCLSEFSDMDKLRLLPNCSHAFHIYCIDTWLLSNSTCPLCRGTLLSPNCNFDFNLEFSRVFWDAEGGSSSGQIVEETNNRDLGSKRVFSVRLGKFRSRNETEAGEDDHGQSQSQIQNGRTASGSDLAGSRRCYSMGAFQYLVCDKDFLVEVSDSEGKRCGDVAKVDSAIDRDLEEQKKIRERCKGESFSVSKIWLWSKKNNRLTPASSSPSSSSVSTLSCADRNFMRL